MKNTNIWINLSWSTNAFTNQHPIETSNINSQTQLANLGTMDDDSEDDDNFHDQIFEEEIAIEEFIPKKIHKPPVMADDLQLDLLNPHEKENLLEIFENRRPLNFRDQIQMAIEYLKRERGHSYSEIGYIFKVSKGTIKQHEKRLPLIQGTNGRPSLLTENELEALETFIIDSFYDRNPVTYVDLLDFIDYRFQKSILPNTMRHIVAKMNNIKTVIGRPMEEERVRYDSDEIDLYYNRITEEFESLPAGVIYNLDESGFQSWVDSHDTYCLVPNTYDDNVVDYPVKRNGARS
jgi:hypothetical protein